MTVKRDFKRRIRQRQARTGESYVTARRHVLASRPATAAKDDGGDESAGDTNLGDAVEIGDAVRVVEGPFAGFPGVVEGLVEPDRLAVVLAMRGRSVAVELTVAQVELVPSETRAARSPISVVEMLDVSDEAKRCGLVCRVVMHPSLAARIAPARLLGRLRELLVAMHGDPAIARLSNLALTGQVAAGRVWQGTDIEALRRFLMRARAGMGGTLDDGATLAFHVADGDTTIPILCTLAGRDQVIELGALDTMVPERWEPVAALLDPEVGTSATSLLAGVSRALAASAPPLPPLFLVHRGQRHLVTRRQFVIGRSRAAADLALADANVSRKHAAVILRDGNYYLKDLGSTHGILFKGMRIDNKRIDEGDVFVLAGHEIHFTFKPE